MIRRRVEIGALIGNIIPLSGGRKRRGKCPFHGSHSDSFIVDPERRSARCWRCGWSGDVIRFVADYFALSPGAALHHLDVDPSLKRLFSFGGAPRSSARSANETLAISALIWSTADPDPAPLIAHLVNIGVPPAVLSARLLHDLRFHPCAPVRKWPSGHADEIAELPHGWPCAPAIVGLVRRAADLSRGPAWQTVGLHLSFLAPPHAPDNELRSSGSTVPPALFIGRGSGGPILLGEYDPERPLFVGIGLEAVLSGMHAAGAGNEALGLVLSKRASLHGYPIIQRGGCLPLFDPRPNLRAPRAFAFGHQGPVKGLIETVPPPSTIVGPRSETMVIEAAGRLAARRAPTALEWANVCSILFEKTWRAAGVEDVTVTRYASPAQLPSESSGAVAA